MVNNSSLLSNQEVMDVILYVISNCTEDLTPAFLIVSSCINNIEEKCEKNPDFRFDFSQLRDQIIYCFTLFNSFIERYKKKINKIPDEMFDIIDEIIYDLYLNFPR